MLHFELTIKSCSIKFVCIHETFDTYLQIKNTHFCFVLEYKQEYQTRSSCVFLSSDLSFIVHGLCMYLYVE